MTDFRSQVERALMDWWTKNGASPHLELRFASSLEEMIYGSVPSSLVPKGAARVVEFLSMPVRVNDAVPNGEVHFYQDKKLVGKITGLAA